MWTTFCENFRLIAQKLRPVEAMKQKNFCGTFWSQFVSYWSEICGDCRQLCELQSTKFQIDSSKIEPCGTKKQKNSCEICQMGQQGQQLRKRWPAELWGWRLWPRSRSGIPAPPGLPRVWPAKGRPASHPAVRVAASARAGGGGLIVCFLSSFQKQI